MPHNPNLSLPMPDVPTTYTALDPAVAAEAGTLTHAFLAEVEAELQRLGLRREVQSDRRRAARSAQLRRPDLAPSEDEIERLIVNSWAPSGTHDPAMQATQHDAALAFHAHVKTYAEAHGLDLLDSADRERAVRANLHHYRAAEQAAPPPEPEPVFEGPERLTAEQFGGARRYAKLKRKAEEMRVNLATSWGYAYVMKELAKEGPMRFSVATAPTYEDVRDAILAREGWTADPPAHMADVVKLVQKERPDVLPDYRLGRPRGGSEDEQRLEFAAAEEATARFDRMLRTVAAERHLGDVSDPTVKQRAMTFAAKDARFAAFWEKYRGGRRG